MQVIGIIVAAVLVAVACSSDVSRRPASELRRGLRDAVVPESLDPSGCPVDRRLRSAERHPTSRPR